MATTHAHPLSSRAAAVTNALNSTYPPITIASRASFQDDKLKESPRSQLRRMEDVKRKHELDEASALRTASASPPRLQSGKSQREQAGNLTPTLRGARLAGNGHASPRTQLPSFNNLTSNVVTGEEEGNAKRRRVEGADGARVQARESFTSPQEYDEDDERQYRREMAARQAGRHDRSGNGYSPKRDVEHFEASSMGAPARPSDSEVGPSGTTQEDLYDSNIPLSRRRGDIAHAKASRLHIDTGSVEPTSGGGPDSGFESAVRSKPSSSMSMHGIAKSAPPHKMTFADRDGGVPFDPRGEAPPSLSQSRSYPSGHLPLHQPYYPAVYSRKDGAVSQESHSFNDASPGQSRRVEYSQGHSHSGMQQQQQQQQQQHARHPLPSAGTPLTAVRSNVFVPQTATLPSPAYHTTHFMRNPMGAGSNSHGVDPRVAAGNTTNPPKTAGFNPPPTARLPEHLRSPPSSKTQFLSLFSNFYDSLTDSRTLKHTLEDQVRRSNTLLQTLQKSSRVLELTVDRRVREERILWEAKVHALEQRCLQLEKHLGTATQEEVSPAPLASPNDTNDARISPEAQKTVAATKMVSPSQVATEEEAQIRMDE